MAREGRYCRVQPCLHGVGQGGLRLLEDDASVRKKKDGERLGNGWIGEVAEWACRTYKWRLDYVLYEIPAVQLAMLMRINVQGDEECKTTTLLDDMYSMEIVKAQKNG